MFIMCNKHCEIDNEFYKRGQWSNDIWPGEWVNGIYLVHKTTE